MSETLPAVFFGHGNPMNALQENAYTEGWRRVGQLIPRPRAILSISAHWFIPRTAVTTAARPRTIHDFGGFPQALFEVEYPAPGHEVLAQSVRQLMRPDAVEFDDHWGLDHGSWSVLRHVYPEANIPIVQLSINESHPARWHFDLGRRLAPLREEGVLIMGSGNLVHNLHTYAWGKHVQDPYDWAVRFEGAARAWMDAGDWSPLVNYEQAGKDAQLSAPTPEHFLPLLYVLGSAKEDDEVSYPVEGFDGGSISMLCVQVG